MRRNPEHFLMSYKFQGERKSQAARMRSGELYHPIVATITCRRYLKFAIDAQGLWPSKILVVRLEDLLLEPVSKMESIRSHLSLPKFHDECFSEGNSSSAGFRDHHVLSNADRACLWLFCAGPAAKVGYSISRPRWSIILLVCQIFTLMPWLYNNFFFLRSADSAGIVGFIKRYFL